MSDANALLADARDALIEARAGNTLLCGLVGWLARGPVWDVEHDRAALAGLIEGHVTTRELRRVVWNTGALSVAVSLIAIVDFVRRARRGEERIVDARVAAAVQRTIQRVPRTPGYARRRALEDLYLRARPQDTDEIMTLPIVTRAVARRSLGALLMRGTT